MPLIDQQQFIALVDEVGGDTELVGTLVDTYLSELPGRLAAIEAAVAAGDVGVLASAAHGLKSPSVTLAITGLAEPSRAIEALAKGGSMDGAQALVGSMRAMVPEVEAELRRLIAA